jgi:L-lactate dehydrogenase complex protein LldG
VEYEHSDERTALADRTAFLTTIREAAACGRAHRVALNPEATHTAAYVGGGTDLVGSFLTEWIAVGGQGERVSGAAGLREYLNRLLDSSRPRRVIRWSHELLERLNVDTLLAERQIQVTPWSELEQQTAGDRWPTAFAADLGITSVNWAVAETGTLALFAVPGQGRVVSLLPATYLAIIEPSQIVPDLFDLFERIGELPSDLPSNISLVTGPSKTGDIELKLTTGVHGPGNVNVVVVED